MYHITVHSGIKGIQNTCVDNNKIFKRDKQNQFPFPAALVIKCCEILSPKNSQVFLSSSRARLDTSRQHLQQCHLL